jgi:hypothetical protein
MIPMPKPKQGETEKQFISRCMTQLSKEDGKLTQKQKLGKCYGIFNNSKEPHQEDIDDINKFIKNLDFVFDIEDLQK